jgi:hypothetical protein
MFEVCLLPALFLGAKADGPKRRHISKDKQISNKISGLLFDHKKPDVKNITKCLKLAMTINEPELRGTELSSIATAYSIAGDNRTAVSVFREALRIARSKEYQKAGGPFFFLIETIGMAVYDSKLEPKSKQTLQDEVTDLSCRLKPLEGND